jgi:sulfur carrier protein
VSPGGPLRGDGATGGGTGLDVTVNGEPRRLPEGATVAWLVDEMGAGRRGVAVAIDAEVVVRSRWETTRLHPGAKIEVLRAVQGGC